jgi:guanosine-3',5'-bis(diphosphate) 3'-pyrophosphohydrolase
VSTHLTGVRLVSEAAAFAARQHNGLPRKGRDDEPAINHLAEVAGMLAHATEGADAELIAAGWLHDTLEDTGTSRAALAAQFGPKVADYVSEVTDDTSMPKDERRRKQIECAPNKTRVAKLIEIADKTSNVRARTRADLTQNELDDLLDYADFAVKVIHGCRGENALLERWFDEAIKAARKAR